MKTVLYLLFALVICANCLPIAMLQADEHVYVYPFPLNATDKLIDGPNGDAVPLVDGTTLVWVDLVPQAKFAHPSAYILICGNKTQVIEGEWWPVLNGNRILYSTASPQLIRTEGRDALDAAPQSLGGDNAKRVHPSATPESKDAADTTAAEKGLRNVIRPSKENAEVQGCQVSKPGTYQASLGDLIEIEYTYPVVPGAMPKEVAQETDRGAIYTSKLGIRHLMVPHFVGTGTYVSFFDAGHIGKGTATVTIDDVKYEYVFEVSSEADETPANDEEQDATGPNQEDMWRAWAITEATETRLTVEGIYADGGPGLVTRLKPAVPQGINPKILLLDLQLASLPGSWPTVVIPIPACHVQAPYKKGQYDSVQIRYPDGHTESIAEIIDAADGPTSQPKNDN